MINNNNFIEQLRARGLVAQVSDQNALLQRLTQSPITLYCGFDPTADSLHLGHLIPILYLKRFQLVGHQPIVVIGGATAMIGDPSFKGIERSLKSIETIQNCTKAIEKQLSTFLDFSKDIPNHALLVNNYDWFADFNVLAFLRDVGKHFSVNTMINREAVQQRLQRPDIGISFTEFSYNLLQAYDFAQLNNNYGVELQLGGTDQWGNMVAGIDLTRRLNKKTVYALTFPLITKTDGTKFGKTESGTIWLDPLKTSPYRFYQFWLTTKDTDVYHYLSLFTFLTTEEILAIRDADCSSQQAPQAQHILAREVTELVHGTKALLAVQRINNSLFNNDYLNLTASDFAQLAQDGIPSISCTMPNTLLQALVAANFAPSQSQARSLIAANAVTINGKKCLAENYVFSAADKLHSRYTLLKRGKKHFCLIQWPSD